ncbi:MAG: DUF2163 domain-containing protein [Pseudomonadota bacterium]
MNDFNHALKTHLSEETTTTCTCWILRRRDGLVMGFTDHNRPLTIENVTCSAATGFQPTQAMAQLGLAADNQDIAGAFSADSITETDLHAGRYDGARVEIWLVNWAQTDQREHLRTSVLGEVSRQDGRFTAELRSLTSLLDQKIGRTFSRRCDAQLGDGRCQVQLHNAAFKGYGTVSAVEDNYQIKVSGLEAYPVHWFQHGNLTWRTGRNVGLSTEVATHAQTGALSFAQTLPERAETGDQFEITAGCDKQFSTCKSKFANGINFQGCPHMPGTDFALGYPSRDDVHDGSPLMY